MRLPTTLIRVTKVATNKDSKIKLISDRKLAMPIPDVPSISYGATDNEVYDWQVRDRDKLWEDKKEEYKARPRGMARDNNIHVPQARRSWV